MFSDFDWSTACENLLRIFLTFVLALPLAWDRERSDVSMDRRTFPIVALASCSYVFLAVKMPPPMPSR